jgi:hypothetical protein
VQVGHLAAALTASKMLAQCECGKILFVAEDEVGAVRKRGEVLPTFLGKRSERTV